MRNASWSPAERGAVLSFNSIAVLAPVPVACKCVLTKVYDVTHVTALNRCLGIFCVKCTKSA